MVSVKSVRACVCMCERIYAREAYSMGEEVQQRLALILSITIQCPEAVLGWECISFHETLAVLIRLWLLGRTDKL